MAAVAALGWERAVGGFWGRAWHLLAWWHHLVWKTAQTGPGSINSTGGSVVWCQTRNMRQSYTSRSDKQTFCILPTAIGQHSGTVCHILCLRLVLWSWTCLPFPLKKNEVDLMKLKWAIYIFSVAVNNKFDIPPQSTHNVYMPLRTGFVQLPFTVACKNMHTLFPFHHIPTINFNAFNVDFMWWSNKTYIKIINWCVGMVCSG